VSIGKGGKNYKKGKKRDEGETRRDLLFKEDGQGSSAFYINVFIDTSTLACITIDHHKFISVLIEYAQVLRMLGDGRLALQCYDDVARTGDL